MSRKFKYITVALVMGTVLLVFLLPSINLEPTALRAIRAAQALAGTLLSVATMVNILLTAVCFQVLRRIADGSARQHGDLLVLNCTRLC